MCYSCKLQFGLFATGVAAVSHDLIFPVSLQLREQGFSIGIAAVGHVRTEHRVQAGRVDRRLEGAQPEVIRAIGCSGSALHRIPR